MLKHDFTEESRSYYLAAPAKSPSHGDTGALVITSYN